VTYVIAKPCIDVEERACVDTAHVEGTQVVDGLVDDRCTRNPPPATESRR